MILFAGTQKISQKKKVFNKKKIPKRKKLSNFEKGFRTSIFSHTRIFCQTYESNHICKGLEHKRLSHFDVLKVCTFYSFFWYAL